MTGDAAAPAVFARVERFASVGSTNDVVRGWLADGEPEVCLAVADEQTAGRGRHGRTWSAPPDAALLASLGFRPTWLPPDRTWRLAAYGRAGDGRRRRGRRPGCPSGAIRLKWPNDLVIEVAGPNALLIGELDAQAAATRLASPVDLRKLAGVLGESDGLGTDDPRVVVGIGVNADWRRARLSAGPGGLHDQPARGVRRPADRPVEALLAAFTDRLEARGSTPCGRATSTSRRGPSARRPRAGW